MKRIKHGFLFLLSPIILIVAVILFVLDNMNVDVNPVSRYIVKAGQD